MNAAVHVAFKAPKPPKAPSLPKLGAIDIKGAKNGFAVQHFKPGALRPSATFIFPHLKGAPNIAPLVNHLKENVKHLWLGGKSMEPRMPGAGKAHREKQLNASSYPSANSSF